MRMRDILNENYKLIESKSSPLYHFTSFSSLYRILASDTLLAPGGIIYFTRDYDRQFIPHKGSLLSQSYGLRINQELLSRDYGRKLQAGGQDVGWSDQKRKDYMSDPKNAQEIEKVKQTGRGSGSYTQGIDPKDIVQGTVGLSRRWESEEHLYVQSLPNLKKYITGIVIGKAPVGSGHSVKEIDPDELTRLADVIIGLFSGPKSMEQRNWFLDTVITLGVPIIYNRKEFDSKQVKRRIIQLYSQRKRDREEEAAKPQQSFLVKISPGAGGIAIGGSDINAVFKRMSQDPGYKNVLVHGYDIGLDDQREKIRFDKPISLADLVRRNKI